VVIPSEEQFSLMGYTDADGNYMIGGIPFNGDGTNYVATPTLGIHQFSPANQSRFFSTNSMVQTGVDYEDVSAFPVSGKVYFENTNIPVEEAYLYVDGNLASKDGEAVKTNSNGEFNIDVPIGKHFIKVKKSGHTFVNNGYYPEQKSDSIIDRETFDAVQQILEGNGHKTRTYEKPLSEKLFCATCGKRLKWDAKQKSYYCPNHTGAKIIGKRMKERPQSEERMIKRTLVRHAGAYVKMVLDSAGDINGLDKRGGLLHEYEQHAIAVLKEKKVLEAKGQRMLDDFRADIIDQDTFMSLRDDYKQELKEKDTELQAILSDHRLKYKMAGDAREILKEVRKIGQMKFETALGLAERIELRPSGLVSIEFRGQKTIEELLES
jgi:predicted RNA-binding Zn-ribbon protein involved in translation (DUF1610 family)